MPRRRARGHSSRTTTRRSGSATKGGTKYNYTKPKGGGTPQVSSVSHTPGTSDMTTTTESEFTPQGQGLPGINGSAQVVLVLGIILFAMTNWTPVVVPLAGLVWNGKPSHPVNWKGSLGMLIALGVMVFLASISEVLGGLMLVFMLGFFMVYLIENNTSNGLSNLFKWLSNNSSSSTSGTTSTTPKSGSSSIK